jgi:hypothetical protein
LGGRTLREHPGGTDALRPHISDPVPVIDGIITAPERPGHGLAFRPEILRECRVSHQT